MTSLETEKQSPLIYRAGEQVVAYELGETGRNNATAAFIDLLMRHWRPSVFETPTRFMQPDTIEAEITRLYPQHGSANDVAIVDPLTFELRRLMPKDEFKKAYMPVTGSYAWHYPRQGEDTKVFVKQVREEIAETGQSEAAIALRWRFVLEDDTPIRDTMEFVRGKVRIAGNTSMLADAPLAIQAMQLADIAVSDITVVETQQTHINILLSLAQSHLFSVRSDADYLLAHRLLTEGNGFLFPDDKPLPRMVIDSTLANHVQRQMQELPRSPFIQSFCIGAGIPPHLFTKDSETPAGRLRLRKRFMELLSKATGQKLTIGREAFGTYLLLPGLRFVYELADDAMEMLRHVMNEVREDAVAAIIDEDGTDIILADDGDERVLMVLSTEGEAEIVVWTRD